MDHNFVSLIVNWPWSNVWSFHDDYVFVVVVVLHFLGGDVGCFVRGVVVVVVVLLLLLVLLLLVNDTDTPP
jgi:hypothetical protein